jgi:hypothetical protein
MLSVSLASHFPSFIQRPSPFLSKQSHQSGVVDGAPVPEPGKQIAPR